MKVGILSMQQITNYGSFLQAYGLKRIIEELGHDVEFINIIPGKQLPQYSINRFHRIKLLFRRMLVKHPMLQLKYTVKLHRRFDREFKPELGVHNDNDNVHFDIAVIGSDEVFNVAQRTWFGFSAQLFGQGIDAEKTISYAGCFGATTIDVLDTLGIKQQISDLLKKFAAISVRDKNSAEIVINLTGIRPSLNVDPVIIYEFEKEMRIPPKKEQYLLVYTYPGRMNKEDEIKAIREFAKKRRLKIISNANYFDWVDEVVTPHPFEVLGYFKNADYIVTDTFHGTVMSLKYNRPFAAIVREMNSNKLEFLLEQFGLSQRVVHELGQLSAIMDSPINYDIVNDTIRKERDSAINYLKNNLQ